MERVEAVAVGWLEAAAREGLARGEALSRGQAPRSYAPLPLSTMPFMITKGCMRGSLNR